MPETSDHRAMRLAKLERLRERGIEPYPARASRTHTAAEAIAAFEGAAEGEHVEAQIAGRLMSVRVMGKSTFAHIADGSGRVQIYLRQDEIGEDAYDLFRRDVDLGDFISARGQMFRTRTGEASLHVEAFELLAKALLPLPEKWHGLRDVEIRYRQRYLDLIANPEVRDVFIKRTDRKSVV